MAWTEVSEVEPCPKALDIVAGAIEWIGLHRTDLRQTFSEFVVSLVCRGVRVILKVAPLTRTTPGG